MRDRLFLFSGILGIGALVMSLVLAIMSPRHAGPMPQGFITPVMAFEFARNEAEVWQLLRPAGAAAAMDRVNRWDFLYMALYGLFLSSYALACARQTGRRLCYAAAALALLILAADALENVQLLGLTYQTTLDGSYMGDLLPRLRLFTWLKWGGLALYFLLLWPYVRSRSGGLARVIGVAALLPVILAAVAFFRRGLPNELMALAIGLMFLLLTLDAWRQTRTARRKDELATDLHPLGG